MRRYFLLCMFPVLLVLISCNNGPAGQTGKTGATVTAPARPRETPSSDLGITGTDLLTQMVARYYDVKNALVASKAPQADSAARQLAVTAGVFRRFLDTDTANGESLKPFCDTILLSGRALATLTDESCERQRLVFGTISGALFRLVKLAGLKHSGIYREYCPMAFNEKGAYWLSDITEIKNPYFGKKMLECGEVTDTL